MRISKWSVVIALAVTLPISFLLVRAGASVAADEYSPVVETECGARLPTHLKPGERLVVHVRVECNTSDKPSGTLRLSVRSGAAQARATTETAAVVWSDTVRYEGHPIRVVGPELSTPGRYTFTMAFQPDDAARFESCYNEVGFEVGAAPPPDNPDEDDPDDGLAPSDLFPSGVLPNTGGPYYWLAVLALWLVLTGAALLGYSRLPRPATS